MPWTDNILVPELRWGEKVTMKPGLYKVNLDFVSEEEASLGVVMFLLVLLTLPGVQ